MKHPKFSLFIFIVTIMLTSLLPITVSADDINGNGQEDWGEVFNEDGSINYTNLIDAGEVQVAVNWMPDLPFFEAQATYHQYVTPDGQVVMQPSATTLFFAAVFAEESQITGADSMMTNFMLGGGVVDGANLGAGNLGQVLLGMFQSDYTQNLFVDIMSGEVDIWSLKPGDMLLLTIDLAQASLRDGNLYTAMLLYSDCQALPAGCPPEVAQVLARLIPMPTPGGPRGNPTPVIPKCTQKEIIQGTIYPLTSQIAPAAPIVVGQDPDKRGVDLSFHVQIEPTIYRFQTLKEELRDGYCLGLDGTPQNACPAGKWIAPRLDYACEWNEVIYPESVPLITGRVTLTDSSRNWIEGSLQDIYPGAYVHRDSYIFSGPAPLVREQVQIEDPGFYDMGISGRTSGTPVTQPRNFSLPGVKFGVYLMQTTIIK